MTAKDLIQLRGGTAAEWAAADPVLRAREPGLETDTGKVKYGNGTDAWSALPYAGGAALDGSIAYVLGSGYSGGGGNTPLDGDALDFTLLPEELSQAAGGAVSGFEPGIYGVLAYSQHPAAAAGAYRLYPLCGGSAHGNTYGNSLIQQQVTTTGGGILLAWSGVLSIDEGFTTVWNVGAAVGDCSDAKIFFTRIGAL